jgi:hypothetical protein
MHSLRHSPARTLAFLAVALAIPAGAAANGTVKAAYVEQANPSKPFSTFLSLQANLQVISAPGTLGITSITVANTGSTLNEVTFMLPRLADASAGCTVGNVLGPATTVAQYVVPAWTTTHFAFPTPLVIAPTGATSCLIVIGVYNAFAGVMINGIVN